MLVVIDVEDCVTVIQSSLSIVLVVRLFLRTRSKLKASYKTMS